MPRNKKNESGFRVTHVFTALVLLAVFLPLGIGFVWFKDQIDVMGDQIKKREVVLSELERQNRTRGEQLAILCLPDALDKQVKKLNLGLGPPAQAQIIRLTDAPADTAAAAADRRQAQAFLRERNN